MKCWLVTLQNGSPVFRRIIRVSDAHQFQNPPDPKTARMKLSDNQQIHPIDTYPVPHATFHVVPSGSRWGINQTSPDGNVTLIEDRVISYGRAESKLAKLQTKAMKDALNNYSEIGFK